MTIDAQNDERDGPMESTSVISECPTPTTNFASETGSREAVIVPQEDLNGEDNIAAAETSNMSLPETTRDRPSTTYSFVASESGVLYDASEGFVNGGTSIAAAAASPLQSSHDRPSPSTQPVDDIVATTQAVTPVIESNDNTTPGVIISDFFANDDENEGADSITPTAQARLSNSNDYAQQTATVVSTVDDFSDDAVIRKILQEDLIASGRSTDELQEYIRTASLENVVSRVNRVTAASAAAIEEEEKTEIVGPDSELAWALHEQELMSSATNLFAPNDEQVASIAALPEEHATVVGISEHAVHPSDLARADAHAELIGRDYTVNYHDTNGMMNSPAPAASAFASIGATDEEEETAEATVLDSKPAAVATASPWSEGIMEEATVLDTKPPAVESWSRADSEVREMTVDAIVEDEAPVVGIEEDVHPAEFGNNDVPAVLIGQANNTVAIENQSDAVVVDYTDNVHPAELESIETRATLVGRDHTRAVSYSYSPTTPRPRSAARAVSDPPRASPVDVATSSAFNSAIAALDAMEQHNWMNSPPAFVDGDPVVMPPPAPGATPMAAAAPMAAAQVLDESADSDNCSDVPPLPPRTTVTGREPRTSSAQTEESERSSGTSGSGRRAAAASLQMVSNAAVRGTNTMMRSTGSLLDVLFGESRQPQHGFDLENAAGSILPRTLLPWSVFPKPSGMWVATVNTNQKALDSNNVREASKALRAFSCATQTQAEALARAWAPPRMLPFADNPTCFICESKFAVFRRACHCRNCGVCVCSSCIVQWPAKMLPETYNIKKESLMNVCKSCDWLCSTLRLALLNGSHDQAVAVHATGNVNLVTPFANIKGELFYPVHCAVLGGSLQSLKWLVDEHCCPLRSLRVGGRRQSRGSYTPILTSRGRSLLGIAMENQNLEIVRYLVADKNMSLTEEKGLALETTIRTLEAALKRLPADADGTIPDVAQTTTTDSIDFVPTQVPAEEPSSPSQTAFPTIPPQETSPSSTNGTSGAAASIRERDEVADNGSTGTVDDACIICFANTIDCVVTPCGHQICCMQCSTHITRCPVCQVECSFMRVYR